MLWKWYNYEMLWSGEPWPPKALLSFLAYGAFSTTGLRIYVLLSNYFMWQRYVVVLLCVLLCNWRTLNLFLHEFFLFLLSIKWQTQKRGRRPLMQLNISFFASNRTDLLTWWRRREHSSSALVKAIICISMR